MVLLRFFKTHFFCIAGSQDDYNKSDQLHFPTSYNRDVPKSYTHKGSGPNMTDFPVSKIESILKHCVLSYLTYTALLYIQVMVNAYCANHIQQVN